MSDWLLATSKEVIPLILASAIGWLSHFVKRVAKDVNAFFAKIRNLEDRITKLEGVKNERRGDQNPDGPGGKAPD